MGKSFFICTSSPCLERRLDCQKIHNYLIVNGWQPVKKFTRADLIIINTCSFGKIEDNGSIELIRHYLKSKLHSAKVVIAGCTPVINPDRLSQIGPLLTISPTTLNKLDKIIGAKREFDSVAEPNQILPSDVSYKPLLKCLLLARSLVSSFVMHLDGLSIKKCVKSTRNLINYSLSLKSLVHPLLLFNKNRLFYIRISRGCLGDCSYCAKKFATGSLISNPIEEIVNTFNKGLDAGHRMFFLLSEDIGCYGKDIGSGIVELLNALFKIGKNKEFKIAISNLNAHWFIKYYEQLKGILIENENKILFIQVPIQSASNRVLQLMNRHYSIEDLEGCLQDIKQRSPSLNLTTDMIVGFPDESESDFEKSRSFLKRNRFSFVDIFGYEDRPNTLANKMNNKISREVIEKRRFDLLKVQNKNTSQKTVLKKLVEISRSIDSL